MFTSYDELLEAMADSLDEDTLDEVFTSPEPLPEPEQVSTCACGNPACRLMSKVVRTPHGTASRYTNHRCRCEPCAEAYRVFRKRYLVQRPAVCGCGNTSCTRHTRREVKHGLSCYFRHRCRCVTCKTAMRDYQRERRERLRGESEPVAVTMYPVG